MKHYTGRLILPALFLIVSGGCYNDKADLLYPAGICNTDSVTYSKTIQPILNVSCALSGCHNTASAMGGVVLDNFAGAETIAHNTRLMTVITLPAGPSRMPKDMPPLDDCTIKKIKKWVDAGAPNN